MADAILTKTVATPKAGSVCWSRASGTEAHVDEVFELRPGEWWVSLTYTHSAVTRSFTLEQFTAKFQRTEP